MTGRPDPHGASGSVPARRTDPLRAAVFGGSFDPIHVGHTGIAERATEAFQLERVLWIPARRPPHKPDRVLAEDHMRLAMTLLATAHRPRWTVLDLELSRPGASYTYDTLLEIPEHLARYTSPRTEGGFADRRRELELFLIIGSDNLPGLPGWRNAEDVLRIARPIVVLREGTREAHLAGVRGRMSAEALERIEAGFLELPRFLRVPRRSVRRSREGRCPMEPSLPRWRTSSARRGSTAFRRLPPAASPRAATRPLAMDRPPGPPTTRPARDRRRALGGPHRSSGDGADGRGGAGARMDRPTGRTRGAQAA